MICFGSESCDFTGIHKSSAVPKVLQVAAPSTNSRAESYLDSWLPPWGWLGVAGSLHSRWMAASTWRGCFPNPRQVVYDDGDNPTLPRKDNDDEENRCEMHLGTHFGVDDSGAGDSCE